MPRRLKVPTREKGRLEVYAITEAGDGTWEASWDDLRTTLLGELISRVPRSAYDHLLNGYSAPFINALGISPEGALQKLPSTVCDKQRECTLYQKRTCWVGSGKLPWCYEPAGLPELSAAAKRTASDLVFLWREQVYVIAVFDD